MLRSQAEAEGLTLLKADNKAGYFGVNHKPGKPNPIRGQSHPQANVRGDALCQTLVDLGV